MDNYYVPEITEKDEVEMKNLKEAIIDKHITLDQFEAIFSSNAKNEKRNLNKSSVTFNKLKQVCNILDIKATLILEDRDKNTENPIGKRVIMLTEDEATNDLNNEENNNINLMNLDEIFLDYMNNIGLDHGTVKYEKLDNRYIINVYNDEGILVSKNEYDLNNNLIKSYIEK